MTRIVTGLLLLAALAACGADGQPIRPAPSSDAETGVAVGGDARMGVVGGN